MRVCILNFAGNVINMQFSPIKLPPVHVSQYITSLQTYSHMKIIGGGGGDLFRFEFEYLLFAMPLKIRGIQVTQPTKDKITYNLHIYRLHLSNLSGICLLLYHFDNVYCESELIHA